MSNGVDPQLAALVAQAPSDDKDVPPTTPEVSPKLEKKPRHGSFLSSFCRCFRPVPQLSAESDEKANLASVNTAGEPSNSSAAFLGQQTEKHKGQKTLVLDLDETLVHSTFRFTPAAEIVITVEIDGKSHKVYVLKRPGVDEFLARLTPVWETVAYTASMAKYADQVLDILDPRKQLASRLFREACQPVKTGGFIKDLAKLGRDLRNVAIVDNSPTCYSLQPENAIPIQTWRGDPADRELYDLMPILEALAAVDNIPETLQWVIGALDEQRVNSEEELSDGESNRRSFPMSGGATNAQNEPPEIDPPERNEARSSDEQSTSGILLQEAPP
jgi:RNA polymerase II subunit A small phosphatase-like protein